MQTALGSYAFLNAKLKARISKLLPPDAIEELIRAKSLPETLLLLRQTRFEGIESSYASTGDLQSGEAMMCASDAKVFSELFRYAKGSIRDFLEASSLRFEIDKLKNILRLWFDARTRAGDIIGMAAYLDRAPIVHKIDVDGLLASLDENEMAKTLKGTPYAAIVAAHLPKAIELGNMFKLELALDRYYFDTAFEAAGKLEPNDRAIARRALSMDADAQNADRLVRFKTFFSMSADEALACLIPYGAAAKARGLSEAYAQDGTEAIAKRALGGALGRIASFVGSSGEGKAGAGLMEKAFRAIALDEARRLLGGYPFSIGIALAYATLRKDEVRVVMIILNAKYFGLSEERIRNAL